MKQLISNASRISFTERSVPLFLLAVMTLALGLFIPELGFYQDDWIFVFVHQAQGTKGLIEFLNYDGHPLGVWSLVLSFGILGSKPLYWHIFSLLLRWLTASILWFILIRLWPNYKDRAFAIALIFALHPAFTIQSQALIYSQVWLSYFILGASFYLTVLAIQNPKQFTRYILLAILLKLLHAATDEYTWGTELIRPFLIWFALSNTEASSSSRLKRTIGVSLPFAAIVIPQFLWRGLFYESPVLSRSEPHLFNELLQAPMSTLVHLIQKEIPDVIWMLFSSWNRIIEASYFDFSQRINLYLVIIQLIATIAIIFFLQRSTLFSNATVEDEKKWTKEILILGVAGMIVGMSTTVAAGYFIVEKLPPWNSRFVFGPLIGIAVLTGLFFYLMFTSRRAQIVVLAILAGALVNWHERTADGFRYSWQKQENLYQQLIWRAPSIKPNTAIIASQEILGYMGDYPTSYSINSIYESQNIKEIPYWFFALSENFNFSTESLFAENALEVDRANVTFRGDTRNIIFIEYEPENGQCLWVLRPEDAEYKYLATEMKKAVLESNYENISSDQTENSLLNEIMNENKDTWCYYYQKADLARQNKDWKMVVGYWEQAQQHDYRPGNGFEYVVFIEGYAHQQDWKKALTLTNDARKTTQGMYLILCPTWERLALDVPASEEKDARVAEAYEMLKCAP